MRIFAFEVLKIPFASSAAQSENTHKSKAPSERELAPKATEGKCATCVFLLFSGLKLLLLPLLSLRHKGKNTHESKAPSERELAPKATEGECETFGFSPFFSPAGSFRHARA